MFRHSVTSLFSDIVVQLLKSWEYKNKEDSTNPSDYVVQLLKSWEYKNETIEPVYTPGVVQLLKSWEYKNVATINIWIF